MKTKLTSVIVTIAACAFASGQAPKEDGKKGPRKPKTERPELSEEQKAARKAAMEKRRAEFEAKSPEEKAALKAEMEKRVAAWKALTDEQRKAKMDQMRALYKKHDGDREALAKDEEFKKLRAEMPIRGGRGGRGERPAGKGGAEGRGKGKGKGAPKKAEKPAGE